MYGDLETKGPTTFLMKYSAGITAPPHTHAHDYYAVVVSGSFRHYLQEQNEYEVLTPGCTWFQKGNVVHCDACVGDDDCILSIFWPHGFDVTFIEAPTP
jgi:quercetin dioxygenase-like cupin family protein